MYAPAGGGGGGGEGEGSSRDVDSSAEVKELPTSLHIEQKLRKENPTKMPSTLSAPPLRKLSFLRLSSPDGGGDKWVLLVSVDGGVQVRKKKELPNI